MANENELLIKLNADTKNVKKAFDDTREQTEDLEGALANVAKVSAVAFAALTAEVIVSVAAFHEAEQATKNLTNALQNQGIYTKQLVDDYKNYASAVQEVTGLDDDAVVQAQAVAQQYLGQTKITKELTFAIADLSEKMGGDLSGAAEVIGKTIGTSTNVLKRQGLELSATATEAEKYQKVIEFVNLRAGGLAETANQGIGGLRGLKAAFGDVQEAIGARFAPVIEVAIKGLTRFFNFISESPEITNLIVAFTTAGLVISALGVAIPAAVTALGILKAAFAALGVTTTATKIAVQGLIGATGIGLLVIAITELALHWDTVWANIKAVGVAAMNNIAQALIGFSKILSGAFVLDFAMIEAGFDQVVSAAKQAGTDFVAVKEETNKAARAADEEQNADKKAAADEAARIEQQKQANLMAIRRAETELLRLEVENQSAQAIELKQQEIANLKALSEERSAEEIVLLQQRREQILALEDEQAAQDVERQAAFQQVMQDSKTEIMQQGFEADTALRQDQIAVLQAQVMTEADVERKILADMAKERTAARNKELEDRKKYGEAVATINSILASSEIQGVKSATGELVALQNSRNSTLKAIGKAAAVAQITVKTAESAINIYNGFSTIPIVGPALGIAGAAAAVAYGAEQIGNVTGAQDGGLIEGGIAGRDSVPALLEPGELVVPRRNFDDVVGSVQNGGGDNSEIVAALARIEEKLSAPGTTIIQGDVLADESYVDSLIRKISDAVEFRNAQIFGVTA